MPVRTPFADLPVPQQAGMLCNDEQFRYYAGAQTIGRGARLTPSAAAEFLRSACGIASRRDLATDKAAQARFESLRTEFDAWRGKIPNQR